MSKRRELAELLLLVLGGGLLAGGLFALVGPWQIVITLPAVIVASVWLGRRHRRLANPIRPARCLGRCRS